MSWHTGSVNIHLVRKSDANTERTDIQDLENIGKI
jgi:hypothetical protein